MIDSRENHVLMRREHEYIRKIAENSKPVEIDKRYRLKFKGSTHQNRSVLGPHHTGPKIFVNLEWCADYAVRGSLG